MTEENKVVSFSGEYRWLSNFWVAPISIVAFDEPWVFSSTEQVFQMAKLEHTDLTRDEKRTLFEEVAELHAPGESKRFGRRIPKLNIDGWNAARDQAMAEIVEAKFSQHSELRERFLDLDGYYIEEGNHWGDRYWGVDGTGLNKLGKILMALRDRWLEDRSAAAHGWAPPVLIPRYSFDAPRVDS